MPLLQVSRNPAAPPGPVTFSDFNDAMATLGATHYWKLDELSGDFVDTQGNWDFTVPATLVERGVVGPLRGTPRLPALVQDFNCAGLSHSAAVGERLQGTTGAMGAFFGIGGAATNADEIELFRFEYNADPNVFARLYMRPGGTIFLEIQNGIGGLSCQWVYSTPATITDLWKEAPGDFLVSGSIMNFICIVQRADGNGPLLSINGATPVAANNGIFGGGGSNDTWMAALDAAVGTVTSYTITTHAGPLKVAVPFIFDGSTPSNAEILGAFNSARTDGAITDYCEYVANVNPILWKSPVVGAFTSLGQLPSWWVRNIDDIPAWSAGDEWPYTDNTFDTSARTVAWPSSALPGMAYNIEGFDPDSVHFIDENVLDFSNRWTAANGFNEGTIAAIVEWISTPTGLHWIFNGNTISSPAFDFEFRTGGAGLIVQIRRGAASNIYRVGIDPADVPASAGDPILVVFTQDGSGLRCYVNGVDLTSVASVTLTGTSTTADWFDTLRTDNRWGYAIGKRRGGAPAPWPGSIWDLWISRTVLSPSQVSDLWDLLAGNVSSVPDF